MQLVKYEAMCAAIEQARQVDEVKDVRDKAVAIQMYARQAKNLDAERHAAEIRVRAERRCGELLKDMPKAKGAAGNPGGRGAPIVRCEPDTTQTLSDLGISKRQSSDWQKLADVPQSDFEQSIAEQEIPSTNGVLAVHFSIESEEWYTPPQIIEKTTALFGCIDLDPCSNNSKTVPAKNHFTKDDDGLSKKWRGRVYMNTPYGRVIGEWTEKLMQEIAEKNVESAVALVPARVDTEWFQSIGEKCAAVCFVSGRLKFSGSENSAPFPSAVVYFGKSAERFIEEFGHVGQIWVRA